MAADSANQPPTFSSIKFLVEKVVHTDASGTILRIGDQNSLGKQFAMKVISKAEAGEADDDDDDSKKKKGSTAPDPEAFAAAIERARCCAEASPKLGHSTALKYYDFRTKRNWLFQVNRGELLMEFISGLSLDKLKSHKLADLVLIAHQVSTGIAHMHRRNVLHGDLTPAHIMLSKAGQVKILGYGLSALKNRDHAGFTKRYAAPEQLKDKEITEKSDIYNFGATFYHLLTSKSAGGDKGALGESGKMVSPQAINPRISTALNNLIVNCMKPAPEKRPDGMFDVSEILKNEAESMGIMENSLRGIAVPAE